MNTLKEARLKWTEVFEDPSLTLESLRDRAVSQHSNLGIDGIRSVCWKVYLSCLPSLETSTWSLVMNAERERYVELRRKYIRAVGGDDGPEPDLEVNNPLSLAEDSPWQQFFVDSELRKIIKQDVDRTLPDNDYFRSEKVQEQLNDILFIYCKINHDVSYRQGMHELVAHILWVVSSESLDIYAESGVSSDARLNVMKCVLDSKYVEHDTFSLFSSLMSRAKPWYEFSDEKPSRRPKPNVNNHTEPFGRSEAPEPPQGKQTPVIEWSLKIFDHLERVDNELYLHLKNLEIQPQLFGIRWFRLLFSREFPMDDVLNLWDGIFAKDPSLNICIFIGLALLLRIRDDLLEEDFSGCLHKLMRYPSVKDVRLFIPQALSLQKSPNAVRGYEIIRQNNVLAGKPVAAPPSPAVEFEQGAQPQQQQQQQYPRTGSPSPYSRQPSYNPQQQQQHDQGKGQGASFPGNGVLSQHLPPAALDAIKPVAEGFVHVTKNVLESKGGAAINKAIHDMKKNTQSYIRKANSPTPSPTTANFPPMFDQAISSSARVVPVNQPVPSQQRSHQSNSYNSNPSSNNNNSDKQTQLQLGQIVAKALAILETELVLTSTSSDDPTKPKDGNQATTKVPSKAALAAISGLEHVRDVLLGFSKDVDPLVIEVGVLDYPASLSANNIARDQIQSTTKPIITSKSQPELPTAGGVGGGGATFAANRKPINATTAIAKATNSPSVMRAGSPVQSFYDTPTNDGRSPSRSSSHTSGVVAAGCSSEQEYNRFDISTPISDVYVPTPPPQVPTPKPFSFDDLIDDTATESKRSSSPSFSGSRGGGGGGGAGTPALGTKVKSPRSSLAHSQFSWMLNDDVNNASGAGSAAGGAGGIHSSSSSSSISSISKSGTGGGGGELRSAMEILSPSTSATRMKFDPLAGTARKRGGSGLSVTEAASSQQLQEHDPLST